MSYTTPNTEAFVTTAFADAGATAPLDAGAVTDAEWATLADVVGDYDCAWVMSKSTQFAFIGTARTYFEENVRALKA